MNTAEKQKLESESKPTNKTVKTKQGLKKGDTRTTFVVSEDHLKRLKTYSWITEVPFKKLIGILIDDFLNKKEIKSAIEKATRIQEELKREKDIKKILTGK